MYGGVTPCSVFRGCALLEPDEGACFRLGLGDVGQKRRSTQPGRTPGTLQSESLALGFSITRDNCVDLLGWWSSTLVHIRTLSMVLIHWSQMGSGSPQNKKKCSR